MSSGLEASNLASESLAHGGRLRLGFLLQHVLPAPTLRDLARRHGLTVNGFRIDRAPADQVAQLISESDAKIQEEACALLLEKLASQQEPTPDDVSRVDDVAASGVHRLRGQELEQARVDTAKHIEQLARSREQLDGLRHTAERLRTEATQRNAQIQQLETRLARVPDSGMAGPAEAESKIRELERDLETLGEAEEGLRRLLALRETRLRAAEDLIAELEPLVPKGRRRRRPSAPTTEPESARLCVPYFSEAFYRSLLGKDRSSVERAMRAVFLLSSEGPAYPGLETKQIEGQSLWSVRASLKLRVYFRRREDGDLDILALSDREDQRTMLRRLKER